MSNIKKHFFFSFVLGLPIVALLLVGVVFAADVSVTADVSILVPTTGITLQLNSGSSATSYQISGSQIIITTGSGDTTTLSSSQGYNLNNDANLSIQCVSGGSTSQIIIPASKTITVTATPTVVCGGSASVSTGSSGSIGSSAPPPAPPEAVIPPDRGSSALFPEVTEPTGLKVKITGTRKLSATRTEVLTTIIERMAAQGTLSLPSTNQIGINPYTKTSVQFGLRIALAVAEQSCGGKITSLDCKNAGVENDLLSKSAATARVMKRGEFYEMLLKAGDFPLLKKSAIEEEDLCSDVPASNKYAQVIATAKLYGIASVFKGGKCNLTLNFPRYEAAAFAMRTLEAMVKKAAGVVPERMGS